MVNQNRVTNRKGVVVRQGVHKSLSLLSLRASLGHLPTRISATVTTVGNRVILVVTAAHRDAHVTTVTNKGIILDFVRSHAPRVAAYNIDMLPVDNDAMVQKQVVMVLRR